MAASALSPPFVGAGSGGGVVAGGGGGVPAPDPDVVPPDVVPPDVLPLPVLPPLVLPPVVPDPELPDGAGRLRPPRETFSPMLLPARTTPDLDALTTRPAAIVDE